MYFVGDEKFDRLALHPHSGASMINCSKVATSTRNQLINVFKTRLNGCRKM